ALALPREERGVAGDALPGEEGLDEVGDLDGVGVAELVGADDDAVGIEVQLGDEGLELLVLGGGAVVDEGAAAGVDDHDGPADGGEVGLLLGLARVDAAEAEAVELVGGGLGADLDDLAEAALPGEAGDLGGRGAGDVAALLEQDGLVDHAHEVADLADLVGGAAEEQGVGLRVDGEAVGEVVDGAGAAGGADALGALLLRAPGHGALRLLAPGGAADELDRALAGDGRGDVAQLDPLEPRDLEVALADAVEELLDA